MVRHPGDKELTGAIDNSDLTNFTSDEENPSLREIYGLLGYNSAKELYGDLEELSDGSEINLYEFIWKKDIEADSLDTVAKALENIEEYDLNRDTLKTPYA